MDFIDNDNCIVCFEVLSTGQMFVTIPCNHKYHAKCVLTWLVRDDTCPMCRQKATGDNRPPMGTYTNNRRIRTNTTSADSPPSMINFGILDLERENLRRLRRQGRI
ncbi:RING finger protein 44, partial [Pseudolycoriella hygida]